MKKITNFKSILAFALCAVMLLTAMLALSSCKGEKFYFELSEDKTYYTITGYSGKSASPEIPATHKNLPVKDIGREVFKDNEKITSIVIPASINTIGFKAFEGCTALTSVTISVGVKTIDKAAFAACTSLTEVVIPEGITAIDDAVFQDCTALTTVGIPESVTNVSSYAFIGCSKLDTINVDAKNHHYAVKNNCLIDLENNILVIGMKDATIPESLGIVSIAATAFYGRAIENIVIPGTVKSIGTLAFYGCKNLESVEILGAQTIADYAFTDCTLLRKMVLSSEVSEIGEHAFSSLPKLTNVFYIGRADEFNTTKMGEGNNDLTKANVYFYTDEEPAGEGKYWHYVDGIVTIWF